MKKFKTTPFLGSLKLNWCDKCNLPILDFQYCSLCGSKTRKVQISPPGDVRPAFKSDISRLRKIVDEKYGLGSSDKLGLSENSIILLNEASYDDLMDEIIINGYVVGSIRYNLMIQDWDFYPRIIGAKKIYEKVSIRKKYVVVDEGAVQYIANGYNVLAPGVVDIDKNLKRGEAAVALSPTGEVLSTGIIHINGSDLTKTTKGIVLKPKQSLKDFKENPNLTHKKQTMNSAIEANKVILEKYEKKAILTINSISNKYSNLPLSVSFSGGKDSLVCLHLLQKIKLIDYKILFVNTGLEFPDTLDYIENLIDKLKLRTRYCRIDVPGEKFWNAVEQFGPPGKDYRYCCKILKIGPVNELINQCVGKKTLSIIGQRAYESIARSHSKILWTNPWIPNQLNFTPIQNWTALHVWFYIFKEKLFYNPLYEKGLSRIGCWLCPATTQGTFEIIKKIQPSLLKKWVDFLKKWQKKYTLPDIWLSWGLWRWKQLPKKMFDLAEELDYNLSFEKTPEKKIQSTKLTFSLIEGFATCKTGKIIIEGLFNTALNLPRISQFWEMFGKTDYDEELGLLRIDINNKATITISADGSIVGRSTSIDFLRNSFKTLVLEVFRAEECSGCQVCIPHCLNEALKINDIDKKLEVTINICTKCGKCHNHCTVVKFGHQEIEELFSMENSP